MIKAIIFDLGGVIIDMKLILSKTADLLQPSDVNQLWEDINIEASSLCKGEISFRQFCRKITFKYNKNKHVDDLYNIWVNDFKKLITVDDRIINLIKSIKNRYKLAVLSNTNDEHTKILKKLGIFKHFDVVLLSNEQRLAKDDIKFFQLLIKKLQIKPNECIFIDDVEQFTDLAKSIEINTIHYQSFKKLIKELRSFSIKVD